MLKKPSLINGEQFKDERGAISFVNLFTMDEVKRFYIITPQNTQIVRAWQGHKKEEKWFYVLNGSFIIGLVEIDNWENPSDTLEPQKYLLNAHNNQVLHIPSGYANGFRAVEKAAKLLVFSNATLAESASDNYRFDANKWFDWTDNKE
jgi:dTDP-4-dehydrorhamnose 3,5-epimerase-like enzyme